MSEQAEKAAQETAPKETTAATAQPTAEPASAAQAHDQAEGTADEVEASKTNSAKVTTNERPSAERRLSCAAIVPVLVLLLAMTLLVRITGGWTSWVGGSSAQKTDDAILRADITPMSTRVSGTVAQVAVADYQHVKAGDLLVQLKDDDFKAQVAQAEAGIAAAQAALENNAKQKELQSARITQAQAGTSVRQRRDRASRSRDRGRRSRCGQCAGCGGRGASEDTRRASRHRGRTGRCGKNPA